MLIFTDVVLHNRKDTRGWHGLVNSAYSQIETRVEIKNNNSNNNNIIYNEYGNITYNI